MDFQTDGVARRPAATQRGRGDSEVLLITILTAILTVIAAYDLLLLGLAGH